jgi:S-methylmethionine-dependent homocysteine/selenocysteine methylase
LVTSRSSKESIRSGTVQIVLLNGPMGTELERRGVPTPLPVWSALALDVAPGVVAAIHRDYAAAGAVVHIANTFRTRRRTLGERWEGLARSAVRIARDSVPPGQRVAGSMGPLEDCYRPDRSPGEASRGEHAELARTLADAGVDVLFCETFAHAGEAAVAVQEAVRTGIETWVSLTAGPEASLLTYSAMAEAARICAAEGARVVLVNCTPARRTLAYVEAIATAGVPFGAYANAGPPEDRIGWQADGNEGAAQYATLARAWVDAGATVIGGCCGTGPAHIQALASML